MATTAPGRGIQTGVSPDEHKAVCGGQDGLCGCGRCPVDRRARRGGGAGPGRAVKELTMKKMRWLVVLLAAGLLSGGLFGTVLAADDDTKDKKDSPEVEKAKAKARAIKYLVTAAELAEYGRKT